MWWAWQTPFSTDCLVYFGNTVIFYYQDFLLSYSELQGSSKHPLLLYFLLLWQRPKRKAAWRRNSLSYITASSPSWQEVRAGAHGWTWKPKLQELSVSVAYWLAIHGSLSFLSYTARDRLLLTLCLPYPYPSTGYPTLVGFGPQTIEYFFLYD